MRAAARLPARPPAAAAAGFVRSPFAPALARLAGTVKTRLMGGMYTEATTFAAAVRLTFNNAMTYNVRGTPPFEDAAKLLGQVCAFFFAAPHTREQTRRARPPEPGASPAPPGVARAV